MNEILITAITAISFLYIIRFIFNNQTKGGRKNGTD